MDKAEEIRAFMLAEFKENKWEDTTDNRLAFLRGMQAGWKEGVDVNLEKTFYQLALSGEINRMFIRKMFEDFKLDK